MEYIHTIQTYLLGVSSVGLYLLTFMLDMSKKEVKELEEQLTELDTAACEYRDSVQELELLLAKERQHTN